ncbi:unnamed protein product [Adineta steineri]|uniref:Lysosome-associated membrane glycoprotein 5 n=1 Tax=Adineta steineri TaxID=433720 RepID=A0A814ZTD4_9BILA|nr:unnamed protein product [Adineta steineri]CAF1245851.1 unnamed protein product [Adineta steineri]
MVSKIISALLLIACLFFISSTNAINLPGNYTLPKDSSDNLCFIARFDLVLNVEYVKSDGKKNISIIPLNNETFQFYDGTYALTKTHTLTITMLDNLTTITLEFFLNEKNQTSLTRVYGSVTVDSNTKYFPNSSIHARGPRPFVANESLFNADRAHSYRCNTRTKIDNLKTDGNGNVTIKSIDIENLRIQPFVDNMSTFHDYGVEEVCTMDRFTSSNLIPIIVGVCLAVLVIVVLVAYLIGRRRNRNGYQSV